MNRPPKLKWRVTRRRFLLIGAGTLGVLGVGVYGGLKAIIPSLVDGIATEAGGGSGPSKPLLWFGIDPQQGVTLYVPKGEMGQGVQSMMAQLAAEELELEPTQLQIVVANSSQGFDNLYGTYGSSSTTSLYNPLRQAAANLREMLRIEAATQFGVPVSKIVAAKGACFIQNKPDRQLEYSKIVAAKIGEWVEPTAVKLKSRQNFTKIGKNTPRVDVRDKVLGKTQYGMQARVPKMMFGAVARSPQFGATLKSANPGDVALMPGVKKVVIDIANNFAGVVADTRTRAWNALAKLQLEYVNGSNISQSELDRLVTAKAGEGTVVRVRGDVNEALKNPVVAAYRTPLAAHAHLEPLTALVDMGQKTIEAWVSTQDVSLEVAALEQAFGKDRPIVVHGMQMGGSFGRKGNQTAVVEAARLSQAAGVPVQVTWTRKEEMQNSLYRQPSHAVLRGNVDPKGRIVAIEHTVASGDILTGRLDPPIVGQILAAGYQIDLGIFSGLFSPYEIANYRVHTRLINLPIPTGLWRGIGLFPHVFALESFTDELAYSVKVDPIEFRLLNLPTTEQGKRLKAVLEEVRTKSQWTKALLTGTARGVACSFSNNTAVAMVMEVQVGGGSERSKSPPAIQSSNPVKDIGLPQPYSMPAQPIQVTRVVIAIDPGLVVNPNGAALQARGSVVMGLSSTLIEQVTIENGAVTQQNFDDYPILRLSQTPPQIDVHFVASDLDPQGMGEPVIGPVAAAVANAVFALTGQRLRDLPLQLKS
ncbi:molybdopterin cofactor-binding domain-containing protein [Chamaesiphon sp. VAR_48_metabat_403]|uniref:xanthine dehydrogenase family protein molybdopterin-binding subunit n=1 Tax=Chamaesiphon sp. VAR_48_metabat_403 TaxID=2964700 RepID=UPI00286D8AF2|nr:molybdopterin cofactor-binding domain-containing protein [Chamaesiphon sp. VAR_48_metabat_403]